MPYLAAAVLRRGLGLAVVLLLLALLLALLLVAAAGLLLAGGVTSPLVRHFSLVC